MLKTKYVLPKTFLFKSINKTDNLNRFKKVHLSISGLRLVFTVEINWNFQDFH